MGTGALRLQQIANKRFAKLGVDRAIRRFKQLLNHHSEGLTLAHDSIVTFPDDKSLDKMDSAVPELFPAVVIGFGLFETASQRVGMCRRLVCICDTPHDLVV